MDIKEALTFDGLKYFYTQYIKPLKTGAFATVVNNATTTVTNTVLDGRMGKTLADKDANLQNQINTLKSSLTDVKNKNYLYTYNHTTLNLTSSDDLVSSLNKLPKNSELILWINDANAYGRQVRNELSSLDPKFFGYLTIRWMPGFDVAVFYAIAYDSGHSYIKTYTKINGEKWGNWIKMS